jgi:hypothetical protein
MEKIIFNIDKSFYILLTDVILFLEKDCCINMISSGLQILNGANSAETGC